MANSVLPPAKEEVYTSYALKGAIAIAALTALSIFGPKLVALLGLVHMIFSSAISMGISAILLLLLISAFPHIIDLGQQTINTMARKIAWMIWEWDPIEPLRQYLAEVVRDGQEFLAHLTNLREVQSSVERKRDSFLEQANDAESKARHFYDKGQMDQFKSFAYAQGEYNKAAQKFDRMVNDIGAMYKEISGLYELYKAEEGRLKIDIDVQKNLWESGIAAGGALDVAGKMLSKSSKKRKFAEEVSQMIENKYASNIGRLRSLKDLSGELIASFDADKGQYSDQLMKKWNQEKTLLLEDHSHDVPLLINQKINDNTYV